jgi:hypothetical protein
LQGREVLTLTFFNAPFRGNFINSSPFKGEVGRGMGLQHMNYQQIFSFANSVFLRTSLFQNRMPIMIYPIPTLTLPLKGRG